MRQLAGLVVATLLLGAAWSALRAAAEGDRVRFEPVGVVSTVDPIYPPNVISWGTVVLEVTVDESGGIERVRVVRSLAPFTEEAERTVQKWRFRPARLDGKPVRASIAVAFTFAPQPSG